MHPRTEDLLTIRDGEPIDAAALEKARAAPSVAAGVEQLERMRQQLAGLPDLEPPDGVWERVRAAADSNKSPRRTWLRWGARGALAAAVAAAAMIYLMRSPQIAAPPSVPPATTTVGIPANARDPVVPASLVSLVEQSERLERTLAQIPYQRPLMSGRTAGTIVGIEDRIAFIDQQLMYGAAGELAMPQQQALWSERVELMNALVHVRLAQAEPAGF